MPDRPALDFEAVATLYERLSEPFTSGFNGPVAAAARAAPDRSVIDVGAGPGGLALALARQGVRVLATDVSPGMVARAAERLRPFGACQARVMPCQALDVPDESFDAAVSVFGVALVPEWRQGLTELVRVTRPGGRVVLGAWADGGRMTPMGLLRRVFDELFPERPFWAADPFDWDDDRLRTAMAAAGCREIAVETVGTRCAIPEADAFVGEAEPFWRLSPGYAALAADDRSELLRRLADRLRSDYRQPDGSLVLPMSAFIAGGLRP